MPKTLAAVRPNVGLEVAYRRKIEALIEELHRSLLWWLRAQYRKAPPVLARDEAPAATMQRAAWELGNKWESRLDRAALELGAYFAQAAARRSDAQLKAILLRSGIAIQWKPTRTMRDVLEATLAENVRLIRSIGQEHLSAVQGVLLRAYQQGSDLGTVTRQLQARYDLSRKRAALIARHQNSAATGAMTAVRQVELGARRAVWMHSHAGREPRPSHVANDGHVYTIEQGWFDPDEGQWIWPGTLINCRCYSKTILTS